jgi:cytochrome c oxidase assembly protein subunit 15
MMTVTWGAFVAGLDAGLVYNTFPMMNGRWLPGDGLDILEAHGAVQFAHRVLAVSTVAALTALAARLRTRPFVLAAAWAWVQAALGVATLLSHVAIPLAAAHQMGAVVLVVLLTWGLHGYRRA